MGQKSSSTIQDELTQLSQLLNAVGQDSPSKAPPEASKQQSMKNVVARAMALLDLQRAFKATDAAASAEA